MLNTLYTTGLLALLGFLMLAIGAGLVKKRVWQETEARVLDAYYPVETNRLHLRVEFSVVDPTSANGTVRQVTARCPYGSTPDALFANIIKRRVHLERARQLDTVHIWFDQGEPSTCLGYAPNDTVRLVGGIVLLLVGVAEWALCLGLLWSALKT